MQTIWKYPLELGANNLSMPRASSVLSVHRQGESLCMWAIVDENRISVTRKFVVVGTGHPLPDGLTKFIGTVVIDPFVWHVFEQAD